MPLIGWSNAAHNFPARDVRARSVVPLYLPLLPSLKVPVLAITRRLLTVFIVVEGWIIPTILTMAGDQREKRSRFAGV